MKGSQLKVGILILVVLAVVAALALLIHGQAGSVFTNRVEVRAYFKNSAGLKVGAPVNLDGVTIGNVRAIRIVTQPAHTPVEVTMAISDKYRNALLTDSRADLKTMGVLGSTEVDIDNLHAHGQPVADHAVLLTGGYPSLESALQAFQTTTQKLNSTLTQFTGVINNLGSNKGSIGKFINDPTLRNRAVKAANEFRSIPTQVSDGKGTIGKLLTNDSLTNHLKDTATKLSDISTEIDSGKGSAGGFMKNPAFDKNLKEASSQLHQVATEINSGRGAVGMMLKNPDFKTKLHQSADQLNSIGVQIGAGKGTIGQFAKNPSLHNNLDAVVKNSRQLTAALRKHPLKYVAIRLRIF